MTRARTPRLSRITRAYGRAITAIAIAGGVVATTAAGCGVNDGIVGGDCASGFTQCAFTCVDIETDPANCGACGHVCPPSVACVGGVCGGFLDGASEDGAFIVDGAILDDAEISAYCDPGRTTAASATARRDDGERRERRGERGGRQRGGRERRDHELGGRLRRRQRRGRERQRRGRLLERRRWILERGWLEPGRRRDHVPRRLRSAVRHPPELRQLRERLRRRRRRVRAHRRWVPV